MSFENEGLPVTWEEIKAASRRLLGRGPAEENQEEMRAAREYLVHTDCEDTRVKEHVAIPGYN